MTPNKTPQSEPDPTSSQAEPQKSLLVRILKQRFLLVALVVLVFFAGLFGWRYLHSGTTTAHKLSTSSNHSTPALTHTTPPPTPLPKTPPPPVEKEHEVKKAPAHALPKTPPPEEAPGHAAPPTPVVKPKQPPIPGVTFTLDLIRIIDEQVNKPLFGWRPSSIIFGKLGLTDNVNNEQIGVLQVARRSVVALNENLTRFSSAEAYNPRVNEAMNYLMVSVDKFWFPSAPGKYREAMTDLKWYIHDLKLGKAKFYTRVNSLIAVLQSYNDLLGSCYNNLVKDTEPNGEPVSWFKTDDYFYYSKGVALGVYQMLQSLKIDFKPELDRKNAHNMLDNAIRPLKKASKLNPWLVTNGSKDGILANHRADMSTYIGQAQNVLRSLERQLATN